MYLNSLLVAVILQALLNFVSPVWSKSVNTLSLIKSLQDTQQLLEAYNSKDYVLVAIKLIDIKFILDPPEKGSEEEARLLSLQKNLKKIYPHYRRLSADAKEVEKAIRHFELLLASPDYETPAQRALAITDFIHHEMCVAIEKNLDFATKVGKSRLNITDEAVSTTELLVIVREAIVNNAINVANKLIERCLTRQETGDGSSSSAPKKKKEPIRRGSKKHKKHNWNLFGGNLTSIRNHRINTYRLKNVTKQPQA